MEIKKGNFLLVKMGYKGVEKIKILDFSSSGEYVFIAVMDDYWKKHWWQRRGYQYGYSYWLLVKDLKESIVEKF